MNKLILRTLVTILAFYFISIGAQADSNSEKAKDVLVKSEIEDPDLKLSIEELKKKYPINWFDKKYGDYSRCEGSGDDLKEYKGPNLICGFTIDSKLAEQQSDDFYTIQVLEPIKQLSEPQLKSIIVHYNKKSNVDLRVNQILLIIIDQLNNKPSQTLKEKRIKEFLYSDNTLKSYISLSCDLLIKFDPNNRYYDDLALGYFREIYGYPNKIKDNSLKEDAFDDLLNRCISPSKITTIKAKVLEEFKSKIKR